MTVHMAQLAAVELSHGGRESPSATTLAQPGAYVI